eukprot:3763778-Prymnesium_polylepis.3
METSDTRRGTINYNQLASQGEQNGEWYSVRCMGLSTSIWRRSDCLLAVNGKVQSTHVNRTRVDVCWRVACAGPRRRAGVAHAGRGTAFVILMARQVAANSNYSRKQRNGDHIFASARAHVAVHYKKKHDCEVQGTEMNGTPSPQCAKN